MGLLTCYEKSSGHDDAFVSYRKAGRIDRFPTPEDRRVNMLPFLLGQKGSLPDNLQCYYEIIEKCPYNRNDVGKVAYLTVWESHVEAGTTQRRQGSFGIIFIIY